MTFTAILIAEEPYAVACAEQLAARGIGLCAIVTQSPAARAFAAARGLRCEAPGRDLAARLGVGADRILVAGARAPIPADAMARAAHGTIVLRETRRGAQWVRVEPGGDTHRVLAAADAACAEDRARAALAALDTLIDALSRGSEPAMARAVEPLPAPSEEPFEEACIHDLIAAQAARTPQATALVCGSERLTYAEVEARAQRVARALRAAGVSRGTLVGLHLPRGPELAIGALAIWKAGGAYVPLDPSYPRERLALYLEDSAAPVVLTTTALADALPSGSARRVAIDALADDLPAEAVDDGARPDDLAYVIYTSGSTGRPKGVMIEHRNVASFFHGMDGRIAHDPPGVWLAVTSLSFDISVLELFYTLARGFTVVIAREEDRLAAGPARPRFEKPTRAMAFGLFYWGNDDGPGPRKYELLLEGAKFADRNGFSAVWTPERHFHAFGGPYPNPAVTGAAVAAVTRNVAVRAGSCVAPLHHPARIAEEWAIVDNLTGGRAGLAIAAGWQPDDFVLRPENAPPRNRDAMLAAIDQVRRLWRGEAVAFPNGSGGTHAVVTQPRPVSRELPLWLTTAGNPQTWIDAGALGANVLTHLLGQSIAEVGEKIALYRAAREESGHDPQAGTVTLMLHTLVGADREAVREAARGPMTDYLRSAAGLIRQYAWDFPAFKRPPGLENPAALDLRGLAQEEMDAILDFAFRRYFEDSGLFGTVEDCLERVSALAAIGVDEIACLIDYGVPTAEVLAGLVPLAEIVRRANNPAADDALDPADASLAAQIRRHGVTHLQCTPSLARILLEDEATRAALGRVRHLMIGGEALPGALVAALESLGAARVQNMYGPTETTIWSLTEPAPGRDGIASIGTPIANTRAYVLDAARRPVATGETGELWLAGPGVARGYWRREDLTAERFLPDPFAGAGRMYRTGDLVRRGPDGRLAFLGRADHQVKLRGHRIELGEIETCLERLPGVRQAIVVAREDAPGDQRLVAYVTTERPLAEAELRAALETQLPAFMVPARIVALDAFPLTPNKKVDRAALPAPEDVAASAPEVAQPARVDAIRAPMPRPGTPLESRIARVFARVLGRAAVEGGENFFALGGHSLLAVQASRALREEEGLSALRITDIFRFPTAAGLAAHLAGPDAAREPGAPEPAASGSEREGEDARAQAVSRRRAMRTGLAASVP